MITGAGSGIGSALARVFAEHGDRVLAAGRKGKKLEALRKHARSRGLQIETVRCDVTRESSVRMMMKKTFQRHGRVDILVNNAGVTYFKDVASTTVKEFDEVINTNLRALFLLSKAVLPSFLKKKRGMILNIISFAAKTTYPFSGVYSASKSGAEALMNVLRSETRQKGIKIVNVYPGAAETPMWPKRYRDRLSRHMMRSTDVAELIWKATSHPDTLMVEELIIRPQVGDLTV